MEGPEQFMEMQRIFEEVLVGGCHLLGQYPLGREVFISHWQAGVDQ